EDEACVAGVHTADGAQLGAEGRHQVGFTFAMSTPGWGHAHQLAMPDFVLVAIVRKALEVGRLPRTGCRPFGYLEGAHLGDCYQPQYPSLSPRPAAAAGRP